MVNEREIEKLEDRQKVTEAWQKDAEEQLEILLGKLEKRFSALEEQAQTAITIMETLGKTTSLLIADVTRLKERVADME